MDDEEIIHGLAGNTHQRTQYENAFYLRYEYFIREGRRKYNLTQEDSFSAYSDALLAAIANITGNRFDARVTLKTYLFQIFHHKCVDLVRKIANNKQQVHQNRVTPELLGHLPDKVKTIVEKMIDQEDVARVAGYMKEMGDKCREILLMHAEGFPDKDIAVKLGYNNPAVAKTTRLRCREKIFKLFNKNNE